MRLLQEQPAHRAAIQTEPNGTGMRRNWNLGPEVLVMYWILNKLGPWIREVHGQNAARTTSASRTISTPTWAPVPSCSLLLCAVCVCEGWACCSQDDRPHAWSEADRSSSSPNMNITLKGGKCATEGPGNSPNLNFLGEHRRRGKKAGGC